MCSRSRLSSEVAVGEREAGRQGRGERQKERGGMAAAVSGGKKEVALGWVCRILWDFWGKKDTVRHSFACFRATEQKEESQGGTRQTHTDV